MGSAGCGQDLRHRAFIFFFPQEPHATVEKNRATLPSPQKETGEARAKPGPAPQLQPLVSHKPYMERKCIQCHEGASEFTIPIFGKNWDGIFRKGGGKPGPLILPKDRICVKCHEDMSTDWAKKKGLYLHTTAAKGECLKCHDAHQSRHKSLLREDEGTLCVSCHKAGGPAGVAKCFTKTDHPAPCLSCHNPHQGKNKSLLRKDYNEGKHPIPVKDGQPGAPLSPPGYKPDKKLTNLPEFYRINKNIAVLAEPDPVRGR